MCDKVETSTRQIARTRGVLTGDPAELLHGEAVMWGDVWQAGVPMAGELPGDCSDLLFPSVDGVRGLELLDGKKLKQVSRSFARTSASGLDGSRARAACFRPEPVQA